MKYASVITHRLPLRVPSFVYALLFLLLAIPLSASAQKDLNIWRLMDGRYKTNPAVTDVVITGERLREYNLTYYHSLTVKDDQRLIAEVVKAFAADEAKAVDKELTNVGGKLYTGIYRLSYGGDVNRFVFFKDMRLSGSAKKNAVIVIYMEGYTSLKSLQRKFKK